MSVTLGKLDHYHYVENLLRPKDVHDVRISATRASGIATGIIASAILTLVHLLMIFVCVKDLMPIGIALFIHLVITAVLLVWSVGQYRAGSDAPFITLLAVSSAFTGIFGTVGTLLCAILYSIFRQNALAFQQWFSLIFPADEFTRPEEIYNEIVVGIDENPRDYDVISFIDVMEMGSEIQKRRALSKIMVRFHPRFAPAVYRGLHDRSNAIRVQSATCVAKIEKQFMSKLEIIEKARKKFPDNLYVLFALAKFYDDYAYTGLLDKEREMLNREKAIATYKHYLEQDPNNSDAWLAVGRLLFRSAKWQEAADWFQNAINRGWQIKPMLLWYMECLYHLGDFSTLRRIARENAQDIQSQTELPEALRNSIALWAK